MFLSRNKKNNVYPCKPQFYYIKVGFEGVKIIYACFRDAYNQRLVLSSVTKDILELLNTFIRQMGFVLRSSTKAVKMTYIVRLFIHADYK